MATYYIDPTWNGTASGTSAAPYTSFSSISSLSAGDSVLFKRGTTYNGQCVVSWSGTQFNRITLGAYYNSDGSDDTSKARPIIIGGDTDDAAIRFHNTSGLIFQDLQFSIPTTSGNGSGLYGYAQSAGAGYYITIRRCRAFDCKNSGIGVAAQYRVGSAVQSFSGIVIEDCESYNTGAIGIVIGGGKRTGSIIRRCKVVKACQTLDYGGLYGGCIKLVIASGAAGWTLASGTIYYRDLLKTDINSAMAGVLERIEAVSISHATYGTRLILNTATPTTPAPGEYGYTGADPVRLYVNFNVAAASLPQMFVIPEVSHFEVYDCEVAETKTRGAGENYAFYADDGASARYVRCWAHNNESRGFMIHRGSGCVVESCISENNQDDGIRFTACANGMALNNIVRGNLGNGVSCLAESTNCVVKNNIIQGNTAIGVEGTASTVASNNCFYGNSSLVSGFTSAGGDVTTSPEIDASDRPIVSGNVYATGVHTTYHTDASGSQFWNPPSIGAYEYVRAKNLRT